MEGIDRSWIIAIPARCGRVLLNAALDLQQYLLISQNVSVAVVRMEAGEAPPVHSISVMVGGEQGIQPPFRERIGWSVRTAA